MPRDELLERCVLRANGSKAEIDPSELLRPSQRARGSLRRFLSMCRERYLVTSAGFAFAGEQNADGEGDGDLLTRLRARAESRLATMRATGGACVLLTGATGFIGMECVQRFAQDPRVRRVYCLVRP